MSLPIKVLKDNKQKPFIPFVPSNGIFIQGTDKTIQDILDDAATKEYVDNSISALGTLQRLKGRVATVDDLPSNPETGDTYIVGAATDVDSAEYMYIGDKWEKLGNLTGTEGFVTTQDLNSAISDLNATVQNDISTSAASTLSSANSEAAQAISDAFATNTFKTIDEDTNATTLTDGMYFIKEDITVTIPYRTVANKNATYTVIGPGLIAIYNDLTNTDAQLTVWDKENVYPKSFDCYSATRFLEIENYDSSNLDLSGYAIIGTPTTGSTYTKYTPENINRVSTTYTWTYNIKSATDDELGGTLILTTGTFIIGKISDLISGAIEAVQVLRPDGKRYKITSATVSTMNVSDVTPILKADMTSAIATAKTEILAAILDMVYPVGSIYMSVDSTNPETIFGGSWERIANGKMLVGIDSSNTWFDTVGSTGSNGSSGSWSHNHSLDTSTALAAIQLNTNGSIDYNEISVSTSMPRNYSITGTGGTGATSSKSNKFGAKLYGNTADATAVPPFYAVYIWKRTA